MRCAALDQGRLLRFVFGVAFCTVAIALPHSGTPHHSHHVKLHAHGGRKIPESPLGLRLPSVGSEDALSEPGVASVVASDAGNDANMDDASAAMRDAEDLMDQGAVPSDGRTLWHAYGRSSDLDQAIEQANQGSMAKELVIQEPDANNASVQDMSHTEATGGQESTHTEIASSDKSETGDPTDSLGVRHSLRDEKKKEEEVENELAKAEAAEREESRRSDREREETEDKGTGLKGLAKLERNEVEKLQDAVATQTNSRGLADMLGSIKMDMYRLNEKVDTLQRQFQKGVSLKTEDPTQSLIYPVPISVRCILMLATQYLLVYTAMAVCKVFADMFGLSEDNKCDLSLRAACDTVFYAPMLAVLFLGVHLRALRITQGEGGPRQVTEIAMEACVWSVLVQTLLVLAVPALTGQAVKVDEESGLALPHTESRALAGLLMLVRYAAMIALYAGFSVVCVEVVFMDARTLGVLPADIWDDPTTAATEYAPKLSAAMTCTIGLTVLFFLLHLLHAILRSCLELSSGSEIDNAGGFEMGAYNREGHRSGIRVWLANWEQCLRTCIGTVSLAPMLCILFMAAQMRAWQIDPKEGRPQAWAESCYHACAASILAHILVIIVARICGVVTEASSSVSQMLIGTPAVTSPHSELREDAVVDEDLEEASSGPPFQVVAIIARGLTLGITYGSCMGAVVGVVVMQAEGGRPTPALSPAMRCCIFLATQYLVVYLCLFLAQSAAQMTISVGAMTRARSLLRVVRTFRMAEVTVRLCPMLAVLFVGTRMRALQLSSGQGSPQCWAQDGMYGATASLFIQLVMVVFAGALSGNSTVDESGNLVSKNVRYVPGRVLLETLRGFTLIVLYTSVVVLGVSVLAIRPETATCLATDTSFAIW